MRQFLKWMAASTIGTLLGLVAFTALIGVGVGGTLIYLISTAAQEAEPTIEPDSVLVLDLRTNIQDGVPPRGAGAVLEETLSRSNTPQALSLYQALRAIRQAAEDEAISALYIHGDAASGFTTLREVREAIEAFKAAEKPVIAYDINLTERDYYVMSLADTLVLDAAGRLEINGFQSETQFLAGALEQYGIGVQVLQAGRYKSAIEPFTRTESSPEAEEQTQALLADLWEEFLTTVSAARSLPVPQLQQLANRGGLLLAPEALQSGLVDQVGHYDDVLSELQAITGQEASAGEDVSSIDLASYSRMADRDQTGEEIAVVYAAGSILVGNSREGIVGSESLSRTLRKLRFDDDVAAVVLRINSPGGSATASEILADAVRRLQAEKPVVISMGNAAASGGYMVATGGSHIFASPTTVTGSIGVFGLLLNFQEIANRNGITWDVEKTAQFADITTVARPQTPAEISLQQTVVNELYDRFLALVAESQDLSRAEVDEVAQGRVWSGKGALAASLVDEIGGLEAAIAHAAEQAELKTWTVQEYPRPKFLEIQFLEGILSQATSSLGAGSHPLTQELQNLQAATQLLQTLEDPNGAYMRLPFTTQIK